MISERCGRVPGHLGGASSASTPVPGRPVCSRRPSGTTGTPRSRRTGPACVGLGGRRVPRAPGVLAEAIWDYWDAAIAPHWPRMCGVLEGDVSHRLTRLVSDGLFGLLADLHPDVALDGHLLNIDKPHHATARFTAPR